jgi:hypothetical protein
VALSGQPREETVDRLKATAEAFRRHRDALALDTPQGIALRAAWRRLGLLAHIDARQRRRALLFALDFPVLPVDEDTTRVILRLTEPLGVAAFTRGLAPAAAHAGARAVARRWLTDRLPRHPESYREAMLYVRHHAHHTCRTTGPRCHVCPLAAVCATGGIERTAIH